MGWEIFLFSSLVYWFFGVIYLAAQVVKLIEAPRVEVPREVPQLA